MHSLIILLLVLYYILLIYLLQKVSYIYFTYHTRAGGSGGWGVFGGVFGGSGGFYPLIGRFMEDGGGLRARAGVFSRACGRGGVPPPFFARAQSLGVYHSIVYGEYVGEIEWVGQSECE